MSVNYITSYCKITNGKIIVDGKQVAEFHQSFPVCMDEMYLKYVNDYPKFYKMDNLSKLGFLASEFLLRSRKFSDSYEAAVILSNSSSSLDTDNRYFETSKKAPSPGLFVYTLPNIVNGEISIRNGFKGESSFLITPEFDPNIVFSYCDVILEKKIKICVTGWLEVLENKYNAFLYTVERTATGIAKEHTTENIKHLYEN
jgi:hypothetical protein